MINVGHITHHKLEMQNAADSAVISSTTWLTRGMNAVTATNHVMGEMTGMVIVHHAIGGHRLDHEIVAEDTEDVDQRLDIAANSAQGAGAQTLAYETVRQESGVKAGRTLLDSKMVLKELLTKVYWAKVVAKAMQQSGFPPVVAAGLALEAAMEVLEGVILKEYLFLNVMHQAAFALRDLKWILRDQMLPAARDYNDYVVEKFPKLAERAAKIAGQELGVQIELYPRRLKLPLIKDPHRYAMGPLNLPKIQATRRPPPNPTELATNMREQVVKTSQLARATFPWVNYHRQPILRIFGVMAPLSGAQHFYKDWTDGTSKDLLDKFQRPGKWDFGLYVLANATSPDKGYELWTEDRDLLDEVFSVQAFAWRKAPVVIGSKHFFQQQHEDGRVTIAQALLYNGNRQQRHSFHIPLRYKRIIPERQADVGWDTLNWKEGLRPYELVAKTRRGGLEPIYPAINVNWQTKLVPVSANRLEEARKHLPDPYRSILNKVETHFSQLQTH